MIAKKYVHAWLVISTLSIFVGLYINYVFIVKDGGVPDKAELTVISGQLTAFETKTNGIKFKLSGFEPALIVKTKKERLKLLEVFESSQSNTLFEVLVDKTKEECRQILGYSCSVWSLQIEESSLFDYGTSVKQAQENNDRIDIFSKVLIVVGVIGSFALALFRVKLNKIK
ncbi:hypothetical protein OE749_13775 [Aestuariibacter sp. AA17]|uniref:Uncharacterized protein n=1 Tax=Fluctibacter corallii TaxID=2984329 RepID=A0ABT3AAQ1_9ALTE|nr:hypothetical protein [Aestuariibacter sp. AA17]MCV2885762.1 hypothetical protein [Aestuariibacter sp. AA17]